MFIPVLLAALTLTPSAEAGAVASNFRKETKLGANYWNASAAVDGKMETCWMVPGESPNLGEWVQLDVPKGTVDRIGIMIGWDKDKETFTDYARVKELQIQGLSYDDDQQLVPVGSANVKFEDKQAWQVVDIPDMAIGQDLFGGKIKIAVVGVYAGADYPNLAVSELLVYLKEDDAKTVNVNETSGASAGHTPEMMIDKNPKTFWSAPADGASFEVEAPSFGVARVGITAGPKDYARPKKVKVEASGRAVETELPDAAGVQYADIPSLTGYSGSASGAVKVTILETYPGSKSTEVAVSEVGLRWTTYEGL